MAKIEWTVNFMKLLDYYIENASVEYGKSTAMRWADEVAAVEQRLKSYPTSYTPESLLSDKDLLYML